MGSNPFLSYLFLNMLLQVTGLPGSGKSFFITKYLSTTKIPIAYYDSAYENIKEKSIPVYRTILESACGYVLPYPNKIIRVVADHRVRHAQLRKRGEEPDLLLEDTQEYLMLNPDYIVRPEELEGLLRKIYG